MIRLSEPLKKHGLVASGLSVLGIVTYWSQATSPTLFSDEWGRVAEIAFGNLACPSYANVFMRPFVGCYVAALYVMLGDAFWAYHAVSLVWTLSSALLVYLVLDRLVPQFKPVSIGAAAFFLVYPAVFARLFFERGSYDISLILFLAAILTWLNWFRSPNSMRVIFTQFLILASLLLYEAQIGLICLTSILFYLASRDRDLRTRLLNFVPLLIGIFWTLGRLATQLRVENVHGYVRSDVVLSPTILATRLYIGLRTVFQWAWTQALGEFVPYRERPALLLVLSLPVLVALGYWFIRTRYLESKQPPLSRYDQTVLTRIAAIGILTSVAGQVPMITAFSPSLSSVASRINILPSIGAAIVLSSALYLFACWLGRSSRQRNIIYAISCTPLLLLGIATQFRAQNCEELAWGTQKSLWQQMVVVAPDLAEGTNVVLLLTTSADECIGGAAPISGGPYGLTGALRLVYGHQDIRGWFAYVESGSQRLVFEPPWWKLIPEERRVVFLYDQSRNVLTLLQRDSAPVGTTCSECILSRPPANTTWRSLIQ